MEITGRGECGETVATLVLVAVVANGFLVRLMSRFKPFVFAFSLSGVGVAHCDSRSLAISRMPEEPFGRTMRV